jgi:UDP:flavonoid glycosyltransferase YjiC (YdhE family)
MKIGLQAWGSEGDIRPLIALSHGLARRGHDVELMHRVSGFLALTETAQETIPEEVHAFLNEGPPPVFMGLAA